VEAKKITSDFLVKNIQE